ncbi:UDP-N-acetylhexosamine pyrophosphorylase-like isoform X2 [Leptotrombidium deliense]|uniref:UDP-N-acetylglucosamine diphosphorylase n=1 Tax=Leptotrombidium deliense TaxID=299467 RepID=A0A443SPH1_9ACAR|nr:UDP-N-acetylhexosamine pyrophosphorylase-like isoform X2 [Leptotrombidium deliense]
MDYEQLHAYLKQYKQEHLLSFWHQLNDEQRASLYEDLQSIDFDSVTRIFEQCMNPEFGGNSCAIDDHLLEPLTDDIHEGVTKTTAEQLKSYKQLGLKAISEGRVAALLLAGGMGTRLGVSYPKGMYNVGLPSGKTLFQLQGERIRKLQNLASTAHNNHSPIVWYVMTSEQTKEQTDEFLSQHNYFGLHEKDVVIFEQNTIPCFTNDGKIILEQPYRVSRSPDGNGGLYVALKMCGILDDMKKRGINYVHVYSVDNILVKVADPAFIGYCIAKQAEAGAKVVEKTIPNEAVGVICKVKGKYEVVEYSEISNEIACRRNADGKLAFNAGSICNHFFTVDYLQQIWDKPLKYHVAKKKIPFIDESGKLVKPDSPNGVKLEKFVFDVFQFTNKFVVWQVLREEEFSPLKNAEGAAKDTPTTARNDLISLHRRYIANAGGILGDSDLKRKCDITVNGNILYTNDVKPSSFVCEISPLLSYDGEGLQEYVRGKTFQSPIHLLSDEEKSSGITNGVKVAFNGCEKSNNTNGHHNNLLTSCDN